MAGTDDGGCVARRMLVASLLPALKHVSWERRADRHATR
jgi:hypothetical protein